MHALDTFSARSALFVVLSVFGMPAVFAAGPDLTSLTAAVDLSTVTAAIVAVAALMVTVVVARWGVRKIIGFFR